MAAVFSLNEVCIPLGDFFLFVALCFMIFPLHSVFLRLPCSSGAGSRCATETSCILRAKSSRKPSKVLCLAVLPSIPTGIGSMVRTWAKKGLEYLEWQ